VVAANNYVVQIEIGVNPHLIKHYIHILHTDCLLNHVIEGKIERRIDMAGRRERRRKQQLDDLRKREDAVI
jgi:hypothetical protein